MPEQLLVGAAFAAACATVIFYALAHARGTGAFVRAGRTAYFFAAGGVLTIAAILLTLILTHQFQYTYVWSYSSRDLPTPLLVSTFYAGQEGSFLLWTLFTSIIGIFVMRYASKMEYEAPVMAVFGTILSMLLLMLLAKNPFARVWDSFPGEVKAGFIPPDGRGLNPLLQNYWMVIHPQVLFSGFAAMGVPYAFAIAALLKRDYQRWIKAVTPWMVFGCLILGTGIMMGGFWAYETLGWGGYWGWDPVENSSLVPWIVCLAGIHTILAQRKSGGFIRTNLILGMGGFLMVLYSTFLTRSGVLGETSVHSFVDPGMWVFWLLIGVTIFFIALGVVLLALRWKEIPRPAANRHLYSREFALTLGSITLVITALIVTAGTSAPIITEIFQGKKSAMDVSFYSALIKPLGILISLLSGLGQMLWWTRSDRSEFIASLRVPVILALVGTAGVAIAGVRDVWGILLIAGIIFSFVVNLAVGWRVYSGNPKMMGGAVAHVGLAVMFLGFLASSEYDTERTVSLPQGEGVEVEGYRLVYTGYRPVEGGRFAFDVAVDRGGKSRKVSPVMYESGFTQSIMRIPDILNLISHDLYVAPQGLEQPGAETAANLESESFRIHETKKLGAFTVTFLGFVLPGGHMNPADSAPMRIGARFSVARDGGKAIVLEPAKLIRQGEATDVPVKIEERFEFVLSSIHPDMERKENSTAVLGIRDLAAANPGSTAPDVLVAEVSVKPYINLVWGGLIVVLVGFAVTLFRRTQEASLKRPILSEE